MSHDEQADLKALVSKLEAAVEIVFPEFEKCDRATYDYRLDIALKAAIALMASVHASVIRFKGPGCASHLLGLTSANIQMLTRLNLAVMQNGEPTDEPKKPVLH